MVVSGTLQASHGRSWLSWSLIWYCCGSRGFERGAIRYLGLHFVSLCSDTTTPEKKRGIKYLGLSFSIPRFEMTPRRQFRTLSNQMTSPGRNICLPIGSPSALCSLEPPADGGRIGFEGAEIDAGAGTGAGAGAGGVALGMDETGCVNLISFLTGGSALMELSAGVWSPSGEQILHVQFSGFPSLSHASHSKCGKKSAGLLNLFFRPCGCPYRYAS